MNEYSIEYFSTIKRILIQPSWKNRILYFRRDVIFIVRKIQNSLRFLAFPQYGDDRTICSSRIIGNRRVFFEPGETRRANKIDEKRPKKIQIMAYMINFFKTFTIYFIVNFYKTFEFYFGFSAKSKSFSKALKKTDLSFVGKQLLFQKIAHLPSTVDIMILSIVKSLTFVVERRTRKFFKNCRKK